MDITDFRRPWVRDLAWALASPSLLDRQGRWGQNSVGDTWCQKVYAEHWPWLQELDAHEQDPTPTQLPRRLGHYFESLIEVWLQRLAGSSLCCGLAVHDAGRTLGELDCLWRAPGEAMVRHWELAVKFYLQRGAVQDLQDWRGPNNQDSLADKLDKMYKRQLRLAQHPAAAKQIAARFGTSAVEAAGLIKGWLFEPVALWPDRVQIIPGISPDHGAGWWCHLDEVPDQLPLSGRDIRWTVLPRQRWLAPAVVDKSDPRPLSRDEFLHQLQARRPAEAILVAELRPGRDGRWLERSRGFIVTD